jgi:hypothetical protein
MVLKNCKYCGIEFEDKTKSHCKQFCSSRHVEAYRFTRKFEGKILGIDYILCPICNQKIAEISCGHAQLHGYKTPKDLAAAFGIMATKCQARCDKIKGPCNPGYQHGGKLSPWSDKSEKHTTEQISAAKRKAADNARASNKRSNKIEYWLAKGYSLEEARILLSQRQSTFSLEKCIEKYGEENGKVKWLARQEKWQKVLNDKSPEEKAEINRKRQCKTEKSYSQISEDFFNLLAIDIPGLLYAKYEHLVLRECGSRWYKLDCINPQNNHVVEFQGDFWHANPSFYEASEILYRGKTSQEIWNEDAERLNFLKKKGYQVLIVWEYDWRNNSASILESTHKFLTKKIVS